MRDAGRPTMKLPFWPSKFDSTPQPWLIASTVICFVLAAVIALVGGLVILIWAAVDVIS